MRRTKTRTKTFDCIAFKREAQREVYEETKNLSREDRLAYFRRAAETGPLADWWRKIRRKST